MRLNEVGNPSVIEVLFNHLNRVLKKVATSSSNFFVGPAGLEPAPITIYEFTVKCNIFSVWFFDWKAPSTQLMSGLSPLPYVASPQLGPPGLRAEKTGL